MLPDEAVSLPRLAVAKAWEWEGLGPTHPVIGPVDFWANDDTTAELDDVVRRVLAEPGFYRKGRITAEFHDVLSTLAKPERECYGWISQNTQPRQRAVLVAVAAGTAIKIVRDDDQLTLKEVRPAALIPALLAELPNTRGANIDAFTVPRSHYSSNGTRDSENYTLDTTTDYTANDPAEMLTTLMSGPRGGTHQLYVAIHTRHGRQCSVPLTAVDNSDHGRVLTYLRPGQDGLDIACLPGHHDVVSATLRNTFDALGD